jgi:predicted ATPase
MLGRRFADLDVLELLGIGGAAEVYRAIDPNRGEVAVKVLSQNAEPEMVQRFLREGQTMVTLRHPHIILVHKMGESQGTRFIVMELAGGGSLRDKLQRGPLPWHQAVEITIQLAQALQYAHDQGIYHRDIKPGNIMFDSAGAAKVMDFGLAHVSDAPSMTRTGTVMGTVLYLSPEQAVGQHVDHRSDLYALGAVLFEMIAGEPPFTGPSAVAVIYKHLNEQPRRLRQVVEGVPPMVEAIVDRLLKKDASRRYQSANTLVAALEAALQADEQEQSALSTVAIECEEPAALLVGRQQELETLLKQVDRAANGSGVTIAIGGEAGIGKTRLMRELAARARARNVVTLVGTCLYADAPDPYAPVFEILSAFAEQRAYLGSSGSDTLSQELDGLLRDIRAVFGVTPRGAANAPEAPGDRSAWLSQSSPSDAQTQAFELLIRFFATAARQRPLIVILDDMQWASPTLLQLFHHLARSLRRDRVLLLAVYRSEDLQGASEEAAHPLIETLRRMSREGLQSDMQLQPLPLPETSALVLQTLNQSQLDEDFLQLLYRESEGNPFYVLETLRLLQDQGVLQPVDARWELRESPAATAIPRSLVDLIMRRVERVDTAAREVLDWGAVMGQRLDLGILAPLVGGSRLRLLRQLNALEKDYALLVSDDNGFGFAHNKIRQVLYDAMAAPLRRECHLLMAEAMVEAAEGDAQRYTYELARHFVLGGERLRGFRHTVLAAEMAERSYALVESRDYYAQALGLMAQPGKPVVADELALRRQELTLRQHYAQLLLITGQIEMSQQQLTQALELANSLGDQAATADLLLDMSVAKGRLGAWNEAIALADRSQSLAAQLSDSQRAATALQRSGFFAFEQGNWDEAIRRLQEGLALAREQSSELVEARILGNLAIVRHVQGAYDESITLYRQSIATFERLGSPMDMGRGYSNMGFACQRQGNLEQAESAYRSALMQFDRVGEVREEAVAYLHLAELAAQKGDLAAAREHSGRATQRFERVGYELGIADVHRVFAGIARQEQRWAVAERYLREALAIYQAHGDDLNVAETNQEIGQLLSETGEERRAREALDRSRTMFGLLRGDDAGHENG